MPQSVTFATFPNVSVISLTNKRGKYVFSNLAKDGCVLWDFPGSPVVKTPCFYCRGCGFNPCQGNKILHTVQHGQKEKKEWLCFLYSKVVLGQDPFLAWLTVLFGECSPQSIKAGRETSGRFAVGIEDVQWINVNYGCLKLNFTEVGYLAHGQN